MTEQKLAPAFRRTAADAHAGLVIKPLLSSYLYDASYPETLTIRLEKHALDHGPDGWFHPSTHPMWTERQLFFYLTQPNLLVREHKEMGNEMSLTFGEATHGFIKSCMFDMGILLRPSHMLNEDEVCECGNPKCDEWQWQDESVGSRGHSDGVTELFLPNNPNITRQMFEFKTKSPLAKPIKDLDLDAFILKYPAYYAQQQEYLRMSGYAMSILLFMMMGFPWTMTEIHIPYNPKFALGVRDKYLRVREAADGQRPMPMACCSIGSKEVKSCMARTVCPVALES